MNRFFFNKTSQQKAKMNQFTVLESRNRLSTNRNPPPSWKLEGRPVWFALAAAVICRATSMFSDLKSAGCLIPMEGEKFSMSFKKNWKL